MKKIVLFMIACGSLTTAAVAQRPINIDSLRRVMARLDQEGASSANDTNRFRMLVELGTYHTMHTDSGLYYGQAALALAQKMKWSTGIVRSYLVEADARAARKEQGKWFAALQKALLVAQKTNDNEQLSLCYWGFADFYSAIRKNSLSLKYLSLAYPLDLKRRDYYQASLGLNNIGSCWEELGNRAKAMTYYRQSLTLARQHRQLLVAAYSGHNIGMLLTHSPEHEEEGWRYVAQSNRIFEQLNRPINLVGGIVRIGQAHIEKKQYAKALPYFERAWTIVQTYHWPLLVENTNLNLRLYRTYKSLNQPDKALFHLERYHALVDSSLRSEIKSGRDVVQMQLDKEKQQLQISQLRVRDLEQQQTVQNRTRLGLLGGIGLLTLLIGGVGVYNRKLKSQNQVLEEKNNLIREVTQKIQMTEIAALRAQMNPHFIFNCLNSIQFFTAQNDADKATDYLAKFSRLIRLVLENSKSDKVTLANELETLRLYIEMETMRFPDKLHYTIQVDDAIDAESVQIPPLLLQPFVENAIWHGLMHKEEGGTVRVSVAQPVDDQLHIEISDDGVGRARAAEYKSKSATKNKSFGLKMTAERIQLINQLYNTHTEVQVEDLVDERGHASGTRVVVEIPV